MRSRVSRYVTRAVAAVALLCTATAVDAQQLDDKCTVSVLNRNVRVNADGSWVLPNVPANFGPVRARVTCIVNGQTISGESDLFVLTPNGVINVPKINFGHTTPIPTSLSIAAATQSLSQNGQTSQLTVTAHYSDGTTKDVTAGSNGTTYTISNTAIATITADGLVQAVTSGNVIIQAAYEGAQGISGISVALSGSNPSGIPDSWAIAHGLNPNDPTMPAQDPDRDGLTNLEEFQQGTDPNNKDTDGDGLSDGDEVHLYHTNPLLKDTDGDGISDGLEVQTGSNPLDPSNYNLAGALQSVAVTPANFVITFNTISGEASRQLAVTGTLLDNTTIDLTSTLRGTNYSSTDLTVCNFGLTDGQVFAGVSGSCAITATVGGHSGVANGTIRTFAPTALSFVSIPGFANGVDVNGNYAYVAAGASGLQVVDVTDRSNPRIVGSLALPGNANAVKVTNGRAFLAAGSAGLAIVDITNPVKPSLISVADTPGDATGLRLSGTLAFVADGPAGLQIIETKVQASPVILGSVPIPGTSKAVDVSGTLAIVAAGANGIRVVNVSDPTRPSIVGAVPFSNEALDVAVRGTTAFVADYTGSLQIVDVSTPSAPFVEASTLNTPDLSGFLTGIAVSGSFAFGADVKFVNGVPITDITVPSQPIPRAILDFKSFRDDNGTGIAVDGQYVYLTAARGIYDVKGTSEDTRLYIGQYRAAEDVYGVPPVVAVSSPIDGTAVADGTSLLVRATATDDVGVASVTFFVNRQPVFVDTSEPYELTITVPPGSSLVLSAQATDFGGNVGTSSDVHVTILASHGRISGRVTDSVSHAGLPNATIQIFNGAGVSVAQVVTDVTGTYATPTLTPGSYFATAAVAGHVTGLYQGFACVSCNPTTGSAIAVADGASATGIDFALDQFGSLSGRVFDVATGTGLTNPAVCAYTTTTALFGCTAPNASGQYEIDNVPPGNYYVRTFNGIGYINQVYNDVTPADCCSVSIGTQVTVRPALTTSSVDFGLSLGGRIGGRITDAVTGAGVPNAFIQVFDVAGKYIMGGSTDQLGNYTSYGGLPAGTYFVRTSNSGGYFNQLYSGKAWIGQSVTTGTPVGVAVGATTTINFALSPGGGIISGRLTDATSGVGLANASVNVYDTTGTFLGGSLVDPSGNYVIDTGLATGSYYARTFNSGGYANQLYRGLPCLSCDVRQGTPIGITAGANTQINFALTAGGELSGRVTDAATGLGLASVSVNVYDANGAFVDSTLTDAGGNYLTNNGLPTGNYFVRTSNQLGYINQLYTNAQCLECAVTAGTAIAVNAGATTTGINFSLTRGGTLRGHITDVTTGNPIPAISVNFYDPTNAFVGSGFTNGAGDYIADGGLPTGTYFARTYNGQAFINQAYQGVTCLSCNVLNTTPIPVVSGSSVSVDFSLAPGGRVSGHITDAATGAGLSNIVLNFFASDGTFITGTSTDATGSYTSPDGLPGTVVFERTFNSQGYANQLYQGKPCLSCDVKTGTPVPVAPGTVTSNIDFALSRAAGGFISGRVTDAATGVPLTSVNINIYDHLGVPVSSGFSGSDGTHPGTYITQDVLPPGTYYARTFSSSGYISALYQGTTCVGCDVTTGTPIVVVDGQTTAGVDFALTHGALISGRVVDASTGAGLSNVNINVSTSQGRGVTGVNTDPSGNFTTFEGLPPGTYFVRTFTNSDYVDGLYAGKQCLACNVTTGTPVIVGPAGTTTTGVNFSLQLGGSIAGRVTGAPSGVGLAKVNVNMFDGNGTFVEGAITDANGNYQLPDGLPAGNYFVETFNAGNYIPGLYNGVTCVSCAVTTGSPVAVVAGATTSNINFNLTLGGPISGRVTDASTGAPVSNVRIEIHSLTGAFITSMNTLADGTYLTQPLFAGTYVAETFNSSGYDNQVYAGQPCLGCDVTKGTPIVVVQGVATTGINFALSKSTGGLISGHVVDAATGAPLFGANSVNVNIYDATGRSLTFAFTGSSTDGSYTTLSPLPPGTYYAKTFSSHGHIAELYNGILCAGCPVSSGTPITITSGQTTTGIDFSLSKGGLISGRVTDSTTGAGLANINVNVSDSQGRGVTSVNTDSAGNYTTSEGMPAGTYFVRTFSNSNYINGLYSGLQCLSCTVTTGTPVVVGGAGTTTTGINFALTIGGLVAGTVTDASTNAPIAGVSVNIYAGDGTFVGSAATNSSGDYTLTAGLPAGTYYARTFNSLGYVDGQYSGRSCLSCTITSGTPIVVIAGATTPNVSFALTKGGQISGQVTLATVGTGVSGISVDVYTTTGAFVTGVLTDPNGNYAVTTGIPAGTYFARTFNSLGYADDLYSSQSCLASGCAVTKGTPITVVAGVTTSGVNFSVAPGATITGQVTDAQTGKPVPNVTINFNTSNGSFVTGTSTNASGNYTVGLAAGTYFARTFNSLGYVDGLFNGLNCLNCSVGTGTPIVVTVGSMTSGVSFVLSQGATITGTVTDASSGNALQSVTVQIFTSSGSFAASTTTNGSGTYTIRGIPPGTYFARTTNSLGYVDGLFTGQNCLGCTVTSGTPIIITGSETKSAIDFALLAGAKITGRVTDGITGAGLAGINVQVITPSSVGITSSLTDASGNYTTSGLLAGTYFVRTTSTNNGHINVLYDGIPCVACTAQGGVPIVLQSAQTMSGVNFVLPSGGQISGHVTDASVGTPIANVVVQVFDLTGGAVAAAATDATGAYTVVTALAPGNYFVRANGTQGYIAQIFTNTDCLTCAVTSGTAVQVVAGATTTGVDFSMHQGGRVAGRVVDASTGAGIANAAIQISDAAGNFVTSASADASGQYVTGAGVTAGTYFAVTRNSSGYLNKLYADTPCLGCAPTQGTPIVVTAGNTTAGVDFALTPGARISGRVTSAGNGVGLSNVVVQVADVRGVIVTSATTDATGNYIVGDGLPVGVYYLRTNSGQLLANGLYADLPCLNCSVFTGTPVVVPTGNPTVTGVNFSLAAAARVAGRVSDAVTNAGVRNAVVHVYDTQGFEVGSVTTDVAGTFLSPPVPAGSYFAQATNTSGYVNQLYQGTVCVLCTVTTGTPISLTAGAVTSNVNFSLQVGGRVAGTATDASSGLPLANVFAVVYGQNGQVIALGTTDTSGRYVSTTGLVSGTYFARTFNLQGFGDQLFQNQSCIFGTCTATNGSPIAVTLGSTTNGIDFSLSLLGQISGRITDAATGLPLPSPTGVNIYDAQGALVTSAFANTFGVFTTTGLPSGTYYLATISPPGYVSALYGGQTCAPCTVTTGTPVVVTVGNVTANTDIAIQKGGLIAGQVVSAQDGTPLALVNVQVFTATGDLVVTAQTDADGNYVVPNGLPAGSYYADTSNSLGYVDQVFGGPVCSGGCTPTLGTQIVVNTSTTTRNVNFSLSK
jgi:5-hydroxyisourate hydrolase-like protein (transthyretin family)